MKTLFIFLLLTLVSLSISAQKKSASVMDFYLPMPAQYIKVTDSATRRNWVSVTDEENNYLLLKLDAEKALGEEMKGADVFGDFKLFTKTDGEFLIGLTINGCMEGQCVGNIVLVEYKDGEWENVTENYLTMPENAEVYKILKESAASSEFSKLSEDEPIPLVYGLTQNNQISIGFPLKKDGRITAAVKTLQWDGEKFEAVTFEESPE